MLGMKIFKLSKTPIEHVKISQKISEPYLEQLNQAKGIMENYLKDKPFNVNINKVSSVWGKDSEDYVEIQGYTPKSLSIYHIKKESDTSFLRLVYKTLEELAKDKIFQAK